MTTVRIVRKGLVVPYTYGEFYYNSNIPEDISNSIRGALDREYKRYKRLSITMPQSMDEEKVLHAILDLFARSDNRGGYVIELLTDKLHSRAGDYHKGVTNWYYYRRLVKPEVFVKEKLGDLA